MYHQKNELAKSKSNFEVVVKQFPNNSKISDVLEKLGLVSEKQNDAAAAKRYYNQLVKSFPKSKAAARARIKRAIVLNSLAVIEARDVRVLFALCHGGQWLGAFWSALAADIWCLSVQTDWFWFLACS